MPSNHHWAKIAEAVMEEANMSVETENEAVIRRWYEEVFNQGREDVIDEIEAADYLDYSHNPPGQGPEGAKKDFRGASATFSDIHYTIDDMLAQGDRVATRWMGHLTHTGSLMGIAPTGKRVTLSGVSIYRLANGKLVETHNAANLLEVFQQIGSLPPRG
jgi:predicted ester cyclase